VFNVGVNGPEFFNLPESRIYGAELETEWKVSPTWLFNGSVGLLHTEITDVTGIDFDLHQGDFQKGHELPLAPQVSANAGIEKTLQLAGNALTVRLDGRYQSTSKVKYSPQVPLDEYDSRLELNARAAYTYGEGGKKQIVFFAQNLTGEKYCLEIQDLRGVSGSIYCVPNDGETQYGLQATFGF
jgi:iron complex outermembrane recepter protein